MNREDAASAFALLLASGEAPTASSSVGDAPQRDVVTAMVNLGRHRGLCDLLRAPRRAPGLWSAANHLAVLDQVHTRGLGLLQIPRLRTRAWEDAPSHLRATLATLNMDNVQRLILRFALPHCTPLREERLRVVEACRVGSATRLRRLLRCGVDPNTRFDAIPMCTAASVDTFPYCKNLHTAPIVWIAAYCGHASVVALLLAAGANMALTRAKTGSTALSAAACAGHLDVVELLLRAGADPSHAEPGTDRLPVVGSFYTLKRPLLLAARAGHAPIVRALLAAGAETSSPEGALALSAAVTRAHLGGEYLAAARMLIENGADVEVNAPLRELCSQTQYHCDPSQMFDEAVTDRASIKLLLAGGADPTAFHRDLVCWNDKYASKSMSCEWGTYINKSALTCACSFGRIDAVEILLAWRGSDGLGAAMNVNQTDGRGDTPLSAAIASYKASRFHLRAQNVKRARLSVEIVRALLVAGADATAVEPIDVAIDARAAPIVALLLASGALTGARVDRRSEVEAHAVRVGDAATLTALGLHADAVRARARVVV